VVCPPVENAHQMMHMVGLTSTSVLATAG